MNSPTRLTAALCGLAVLATLGEGGGAVGALFVWHSVVLAIVLGFVLISLDPAAVLALSFVGYAASGPVLTLLQIRQRRRERKEATQSNRDAA